AGHSREKKGARSRAPFAQGRPRWARGSDDVSQRLAEQPGPDADEDTAKRHERDVALSAGRRKRLHAPDDGLRCRCALRAGLRRLRGTGIGWRGLHAGYDRGRAGGRADRVGRGREIRVRLRGGACRRVEIGRRLLSGGRCRGDLGGVARVDRGVERRERVLRRGELRRELGLRRERGLDRRVEGELLRDVQRAQAQWLLGRGDLRRELCRHVLGVDDHRLELDAGLHGDAGLLVAVAIAVSIAVFVASATGVTRSTGSSGAAGSAGAAFLRSAVRSVDAGANAGGSASVLALRAGARATLVALALGAGARTASAVRLRSGQRALLPADVATAIATTAV